MQSAAVWQLSLILYVILSICVVVELVPVSLVI